MLADEAGTTALAKGPSLTVTVTPATTSTIPNDLSVSRPRTPLLPLPHSPTAALTTSTGLGTTTDDDDDVRFEFAGITISKCRNRLKADIVEALQCLKCLIKHNLLFRDTDDPSVAAEIMGERQPDVQDDSGWDDLVEDLEDDEVDDDSDEVNLVSLDN